MQSRMPIRSSGLNRMLPVMAALAIAGLLPAMAAAQTASQLTDDSYAPPAQRLTGAVQFSGAPGLAAPPGAERLTIRLTGVEVSPALPGLAPAIAALQARLTAGRIPVTEIFAAAADLEAGLAEAGQVLARVVIPAQTLTDGGRLRLTMVDGFVEGVDVSAAPAELQPRLAALTAPLVGQRGITLRQIERRLLIAGDTYGLALGSALASGAEPGGTVIMLDPQFRSVTGFAGIDNGLSRGLGRWNLSGGFEMNGFLGMGEVIYARASGHPDLRSNGWLSDLPQQRTLAIGAVLPLGHDGLTFGVELTRSQTRNGAVRAGSASDFRRASLRLFYPLIRESTRNLALRGALDIQSDRQDLLTIAGPIGLSQDRSRVLRLGADGDLVLESGAALSGGATLALGLGGRLGTVALPLSRVGAGPRFAKLELHFAWRQALAENWGLNLNGRAQFAGGQALLSGEQFGIGGAGALSAFEQGGLSGDSGWLLRAEVARRFEGAAFGQPLQISPYVFGAAGAVHLARPQFGEFARTGAGSLGIGLDLTLLRDPRFSSASLRVEYARGKQEHGAASAGRFNLTGSFRF